MPQARRLMAGRCPSWACQPQDVVDIDQPLDPPLACSNRTTEVVKSRKCLQCSCKQTRQAPQAAKLVPIPYYYVDR